MSQGRDIAVGCPQALGKLVLPVEQDDDEAAAGDGDEEEHLDAPDANPEKPGGEEPDLDERAKSEGKKFAKLEVILRGSVGEHSHTTI